MEGGNGGLLRNGFAPVSRTSHSIPTRVTLGSRGAAVCVCLLPLFSVSLLFCLRGNYKGPPLGVPSRRRPRRPDSPIIGRFFVAHFQRFFTDSGGRRAASHRHTQSLLSILCVCVCVCVCVSCVCDDGMMKASHHPLIPLSTPHCPPSAHHCGKHCLPQLAACPGSV